MSYHSGIGEGMRRLGGVPRDPEFVCDGCGRVSMVVARGAGGSAPAWFLDGKSPPGWRSLRMHDGSRRWDLCSGCWRAPSQEKAP
jgi:hypothetical protein